MSFKDFILFLFAVLLVGGGMQTSEAQNAFTEPTILGCNNPAPATAGKPTVFITQCVTPAFVPTSTLSVVGSGSKAAPVFQHTFAYYATSAPTILLVACPRGANITAGRCTDATGKDVSVLVAAPAVASLVLLPPPPTVPVPLDYTITPQTDAPQIGVVFKGLDSSQTQCFVVANGVKTARVCL